MAGGGSPTPTPCHRSGGGTAGPDEPSPAHPGLWRVPRLGSAPNVAGAGATDSEMVALAGTADQCAWGDLFGRHGSRVWAVARAHRLSTADAEDVFQVTFLRLVTHLDTIRDPSRVGAWLATTARHECLRILRRAG